MNHAFRSPILLPAFIAAFTSSLAAPAAEILVPPRAAPGEEAPARGEAPPPAEGLAAYDPQRLEGADPKVAALEAHRLIQAIASREATASGVRLGALNYLLDKLNPARVARGDAEAVAAARIADTMATWIEANGAPFPKVAEVLLPLVGQGSVPLRDAVVRALQALIRLESASGKPSPTAEALVARLAGPNATELLVRDASRALWQADGKALLGALVVGLLREPEAGPAGVPGAARDVYLEEIRSRVPVDFSALEGWQKWWSESRGLPLDKILADAERRAREEYAHNWRQVLRRLRDTGDAERFLLAIEDTLDGVRQSEVRLSAVIALEDFAEWSAGARPGTGGAEKDAPAEAAAGLREKAARILASLLERKGFYAERPEVTRAALAALRKYRALLDKRPALLADLSRIIVTRLQALAAADRKPAREDLLETIRAAGVLRVTDAMGLIEMQLKDPSAPGEEDLEVLTASVTALSRLGENGLRPDTARLLMARFRMVPVSAEKPLRDFRRAVISALTVGSEEELVRKELLELFEGVLAGGEKELRIPALLGLGTLARQREARAFDALREVLEMPGQFETQEITAAIDAIAYVGGEAALAAFLEMLSRNQEKPLEEHVFKKVLSLIEAGGLPALLAAVEGIEDSALAVDSLRLVALTAALGREPPVKELLAPAKLDLGSDAKVEPWWRAAMAFARAYDLLGEEEAMNDILARLAEIFVKERELKEKLPRAATDLALFKVGLARRTVIVQKVARLESDGAAALAADLTTLATEGSVKDRWRHFRWVARRLEGGLAPEVAARWREVWVTCLRSPVSEGKADPWAGFPTACRERYLARLEAAAAPIPAATPDGALPRD